jgi:hypothetical protein
MGWFTRWRERQRELAAGVDADLVQANRQRWKLSLSLWALLFVLIGIQAKIKLPAIAQKIAIFLTIACLVAALLFSDWARAESAFLDKPDRPEPPSIWKFRSRR